MSKGQRVGPYVLDEVLGKGGMGAVYRARDPQGRSVALKVLHQLDPELLARFQREAQVLRHLSSPRIVRSLDFGVHQGRPYLVQELCEGGDLAGLMAKRGALPPEEARALVVELAAALEVAHQAGVVHRDLKPANVLLHEGQPKLTDFGLARARGIDRASLTETGVIMGTPAYMAPEQLEDARAVDARADVYALGVILYELLAGRRAFVGAGVLEIADAVLCGRYEPLPESVPADLRAVVRCALEVEVGDRYASAEALARDLVAPEEASPKRLGSTGAVLALCVTLLLGFVTAALFVLGSEEEPALASSPSPSPSPTPSGELSPSPSPTPLAQESRGDPAGVYTALDLCAESDPAQVQEGIARLHALAKAGNRRADLGLGRLYLMGCRVPRDVAAAERHLRRAKEAGLVEADFLLAFCRPLASWPRVAPEAERALARQAASGNMDAAWVVYDRMRDPAQGPGEVGALARLVALGRRVRSSHPGTEARQVAIEELGARRDPEARVEQAVVQLDLPFDGGDVAASGRGPRELLQEALEGGALRAEGILGHEVLVGRIAGSRSEGVRLLLRALLKGSTRSALWLYRELPEGTAERRDVLVWAARLGLPEACAIYGSQLHDQRRDQEARDWLEFPASLGQPRAAAALADLLRPGVDSPPQARRVRELALLGLAQGRGDYLRAVGLSLADRRAGQTQPLLALAILGGLAVQERDGQAALAAATVASELPQREVLVRPLLRRALSHPATRERAAEALREETRGVAASAPVASQSQFVLQEWARLKSSPNDEELEARRRGALVELGRRARGELRGAARAEAMRLAAETGDPESAFTYAHYLYVTSRPGSPERRQALSYYRSSGLAAGLFYYHLEATSSERAFQELEERAAAGDPAATRFLALQLRTLDPRSERARVLLKRADELGDPPAQEDRRWRALWDPATRAEALAFFHADPRRYRRLLGRIYSMGQVAERDLSRALGYLLEEAIAGGTSEGYTTLGRHLAMQGYPQVALLWLVASAERGTQDAALDAVRLMLGYPRLDRHAEAVELLRPLAASEGPLKDEASLSLAIVLTRGVGVARDLPRAEELLRRLLERRVTPTLRSRAQYILGERLLRSGSRSEAVKLLEAALAGGDPDARAFLGRVLFDGILLPRDAVRAQDILEEGVRAGHPQSQIALAWILLERDPARARDLLGRLEITGLTSSSTKAELKELRRLLGAERGRSEER